MGNVYFRNSSLGYDTVWFSHVHKDGTPEHATMMFMVEGIGSE